LHDPNYEGTVKHRSSVFVSGYDIDKWPDLEDIQLDYPTPLWSVINDQFLPSTPLLVRDTPATYKPSASNPTHYRHISGDSEDTHPNY